MSDYMDYSSASEDDTHYDDCEESSENSSDPTASSGKNSKPKIHDLDAIEYSENG